VSSRLCLCLVAGIPRAGVSQEGILAELVCGPLTGRPTLDAPFSADAITTIRQTLGDGSPIERSAMARYYRDRAGRVRIEQVISGNGRIRLNRDPHVALGQTQDGAAWPACHLLFVAEAETRRLAGGLSVVRCCRF
jgi:hypothetical protein